MDRATGEFLWATSTIAQNVSSHIDGATGQQVTVCPTRYCGKDWESVYGKGHEHVIGSERANYNGSSAVARAE